MDLQTLLSAFSRRYGLGEPEVNNNGVCVLRVGNDRLLNIELSDDSTVVFFSAPICRLPPDPQRLNLFDRLMQAHAFGIGTGDAYFAAAPQVTQVILCKRIELSQTDENRFCAALESFIKTHAYWVKEADSGRLFESLEAGAAAQEAELMGSRV